MATKEPAGVTIEKALETGQRCTVFRKNAVYACAWRNGRLHYQFRDGTTMIFNPGLTSTSNRAEAERYGWQQNLGDSMAMENEGAPAGALMEAKKAALSARIAHLESGSDSWTAPRVNQAAVVESLVIRAMARVLPDVDVERASTMIDTLAAKRNIDRAGAVKIWAESQQIAKAIVDIRAEDAAKRTEILADTIDDLLNEVGGT